LPENGAPMATAFAWGSYPRSPIFPRQGNTEGAHDDQVSDEANAPPAAQLPQPIIDRPVPASGPAPVVNPDSPPLVPGKGEGASDDAGSDSD
jgi:hypothetical protein